MHYMYWNPASIALPSIIIERYRLVKKKTQCNSEEPHCHPSWQRTMPQSPYLLQWDAPHLPPKLPFPLRWSPPHLIHPSLDQLHSPPQMASRSNQSFCDGTPSRQTDRQSDWPTDRWARGQAFTNTHLYSIDCVVTWLIMSVSGWMFLLVLAHPGCPGQIPQSRKTVVCMCDD